MEWNHRVNELRLSGIRRFSALAKTVEDCVMFTLGEPEFDTPQPIVDACITALKDGCTHYTENRGSLELRRSIAAYEKEHRGLDYSESEIIVTAGGTEAIYTAMTGLLNPGDEVIIPTPAFNFYDTVTRLCGASPVPVDTFGAGFQLTGELLEKAITPRTKLLILNSPNNPTGVVYTPENLKDIARLVRKHRFFVLSDDVYWGLEHCLTFSQFVELKDRILSVQSFSKPYAMTGWRLGYLMAPQSIIEKLTPLHGHILACAPSMVQQAGIAALAYDPKPMADAYRARREYVCRRLDAMGLPYAKPEGAFYVFPSISHLNMTSEEFSTRLTTEGKVATVPGSVFGSEGYFRLSYCCSLEDLEKGLDRLEAFLAAVK